MIIDDDNQIAHDLDNTNDINGISDVLENEDLADKIEPESDNQDHHDQWSMRIWRTQK
jgi:hypothetical protein